MRQDLQSHGRREQRQVTIDSYEPPNMTPDDSLPKAERDITLSTFVPQDIRDPTTTTPLVRPRYMGRPSSSTSCSPSSWHES
jgi:hypothetical protein